MLSAPGWNPYVSPIEVLIEDNQAAEQLRLPQGIIPTHHPRLGGAAVFRGTHLAGWLDEREARGLQFARGKAKGGILVIACDPDGREDISIELLSATGSLLPEFKDGQLSAKIEVKATGNFVELYCEPRAHVDVLNERFAKAIEEEIRAAVDALPDLRTMTLPMAEAQNPGFSAGRAAILGRTPHRAGACFARCCVE